jgi:hypothetical protein
LSDQDTAEPPKKKVRGARGSRKKAVDGKSPTRLKPRKKAQKPKDLNDAEKPPVTEVVSSSSEEYVGENVAVEEPLRVQLRPRPKPTYRPPTTT